VSWRVELGRRAERELARLPDDLLQRIVTRIQGLSANPWPAGVKKLQGGGYRIRVGDYRILYDVDSAARTVIVSAVGHRRDVYRR
jgi:mRNA interferase RelE/StbE